MKVKELIAKLWKYDSDDEVVISVDEEMNMVKPIRVVSNMMFNHNNIKIILIPDDFTEIGD